MIEILLVIVMLAIFFLGLVLNNMLWFKKLNEQNAIWMRTVQNNSNKWFKFANDNMHEEIREFEEMLKMLIEEDEKDASKVQNGSMSL